MLLRRHFVPVPHELPCGINNVPVLQVACVRATTKSQRGSLTSLRLGRQQKVKACRTSHHSLPLVLK